MKSLLAIFFLLLPPAAFAADEPEAVYAKFHRAAMGGDLEEMLNHGPSARRAEMQGLSASHKTAALKMAQYMMPRAFTLVRKTLGPAGRATLIVSGPWESGGSRLETVYGTILMLTENGAWKVDEVSWNTEKPAAAAAPKPAAAPPAAGNVPGKPAATAKAAPVVGSTAAEAPVRKLGDAKPQCTYKPVMTAQDMENCK